MNPVLIGLPLELSDLEDVAVRGRPVAVAEESRDKMRRSRKAVEEILVAGDDAPNVYGVNTGFGALAETRPTIDWPKRARVSSSARRPLEARAARAGSPGRGSPLSRMR